MVQFLQLSVETIHLHLPAAKNHPNSRLKWKPTGLLRSFQQPLGTKQIPFSRLPRFSPTRRARQMGCGSLPVRSPRP